MDKDTSEIAKLTERISKDPKSKLFVPLAEEYKKAGDIEMSIHVLTEGLKSNPGYATARSFLGKLLFEKGDLLGAQKEFEEVAKAIPDNLMAQRKLGDLYILQNRPANALTHYRTALSLNPKDQETASLVSDVEAGRDVKARIAGPKPQAPGETAKKQEVSQAVAPPTATKPQPVPVAAKPPATPPLAAEETEEAEEVLVVEPLEPAGPVNLEDALSSKGLDFLSESVPEPAPTDGGGSGEDNQAPFDVEDPFGIKQPAEETHVVEETSHDAWIEETQPALSEESDKQADDFTTDTLAELYIAQGFSEKAVEIYERMLIDNPDSQGLKNKLAKVRAMAGETSPAAESEAKARTLTAPEDIMANPAQPEMSAPDLAPGIFDEYVPPPSQEIELPQSADLWSPPAPPAEPVQKGSPSGSAFGQPEGGFEPAEYVPPFLPQRKPLATGREEIIDRLENWLHKIKKEK